MKNRLLTILPLVVVTGIGAMLGWVLFGSELTWETDEDDGDDGAGALSGRVIDTTGRPVADARVFAEEAVARTDRNGRFSFAELPAETLRIDATADGHRRGGADDLGRPVVDLADGEAVEELELVLPRAAALSGRIVAGGEPVEGAIVSLSYVFAEGLEGEQLEPYIISELAVSDGEGRFSIPQISPGRLQVLVESTDHPFTESDDLYFRPGQHREDVIVDLSPSGRLYGEVTDEQGEPVDAQIRLSPLDTQGTSRTTRTRQGVFSIRDLTEGDYALRIEAPDHRDERIDAVGINADQTTEIEVILESTSRFAGRVVEPDATPVEDAYVVVDDGENTRRFRTDDQGRFEWDEMPDGDWTAVASSPRHEPSDEQPVRLDEEMTFELIPGGVIEGEVVDPDGQPVSDYDIRVAAMESHGPTGFRGGDWPSSSVRDAADGRFDFGPLQSGRYRLLVETDEHAPATTDAIDVSAGSVAGPVVVQMERGSTLEGVVRNADSGEPVEHAQVRFLMSTPDGRTPRTRTDEQGHYELDGLPSGRSSIRVRHGHYIHELVGGLHLPEDGRVTHDIDLEPVDEDGQPGQNLQGIGAALRSVDDGFRVAGLNDDGPAAGAGLETGDIITDVDGEPVDGMTVDQVVELIRGEPGTTVTLRIDRQNRGMRTVDVERERVFIPENRPMKERE